MTEVRDHCRRNASLLSSRPRAVPWNENCSNKHGTMRYARDVGFVVRPCLRGARRENTGGITYAGSGTTLP